MEGEMQQNQFLGTRPSACRATVADAALAVFLFNDGHAG